MKRIYEKKMRIHGINHRITHGYQRRKFTRSKNAPFIKITPEKQFFRFYDNW
jgi:hypothetical protein